MVSTGHIAELPQSDAHRTHMLEDVCTEHHQRPLFVKVIVFVFVFVQSPAVPRHLQINELPMQFHIDIAIDEADAPVCTHLVVKATSFQFMTDAIRVRFFSNEPIDIAILSQFRMFIVGCYGNPFLEDGLQPHVLQQRPGSLSGFGEASVFLFQTGGHCHPLPHQRLRRMQMSGQVLETTVEQALNGLLFG